MNKELTEVLIRVKNRTESSLPFIDDKANGYWVEKQKMIVFTEKEWKWEIFSKNLDQKVIEEKDKEIERLKGLVGDAFNKAWFIRERYDSPDRHGYEDRLPTSWPKMDYEEREDWFFKQFKKENNL